MTTTRLEAFSDGVFAILITIMVLELPKPDAPTWQALHDVLGHIGIYAVSFCTLGIYWVNHHHMFHVVDRVSAGVLWANLSLLFCLSFIPYLTAWMDHLDRVPIMVYGVVLWVASFAFYAINVTLIRANGRDSRFAKVLGNDFKGKLSVTIYSISIPVAYFWPLGALLLYILTGLIWVVPDRRMESWGEIRDGH